MKILTKFCSIVIFVAIFIPAQVLAVEKTASMTTAQYVKLSLWTQGLTQAASIQMHSNKIKDLEALQKAINKF